MSHIATRRQFSRNLASGWLLLAAEVAVGFALTPFIVRTLGPAPYGVFALMISVIGYMGLVDVGIRGSVGRYVNHYMAQRDARALDEVVGTANVVLTGLALLALAASFAIGLNFGQIFPKTPPELLADVALCLPMLALGLWLSFVNSVLGNLLAAREVNYVANGVNLCVLLVRAAATVGVLWYGPTLSMLVAVTVAASTLGLVLNGLAVRRVFGPDTPRMALYSGPRLAEMWRYGIATFAARTSATLANDSAPLIGMWILGPEAVAVYAVAMTLTQYARRLIDQAGTAIFPSVMKAGAIRDQAGLRAVYLRFMNVSFAVGSLVFIGMMVFSHAFIGLWVGPQFQHGAVVVAILAFGYLMQGVASTAPLTLAAVDRVGITVKIGVGEAVACVLLTAALPGLFGLGIAGMALGATLPRLVTNGLLYPSLAVSTMGAELRAPMWQTLGRNLALCAGVAVLAVAVYLALPGRNWPMLVGAVAVFTLLHLALLGHRYEVAGAGRIHDWLATRWPRGGRA